MLKLDTTPHYKYCEGGQGPDSGGEFNGSTLSHESAGPSFCWQARARVAGSWDTQRSQSASIYWSSRIQKIRSIRFGRCK